MSAIVFVALSLVALSAGREARAQLVYEGVSEAAPTSTLDGEVASQPGSTPASESAPAAAEDPEGAPAPAETEPVVDEPPAASTPPTAEVPAGEPGSASGVTQTSEVSSGTTETDPVTIGGEEAVEPVAGGTLDSPETSSPQLPKEPVETEVVAAPADQPAATELAPAPPAPAVEPVATEPLLEQTEPGLADPSEPLAQPSTLSADPDYPVGLTPAEPAPQAGESALEPVQRALPEPVSGTSSAPPAPAGALEPPPSTASVPEAGATAPPASTEPSRAADGVVRETAGLTTRLAADAGPPATDGPGQVPAGSQRHLDLAQPVPAPVESRGIEAGSLSALLAKTRVAGSRDGLLDSVAGSLSGERLAGGVAKRDLQLRSPLLPASHSDPASQTLAGGTGLGTGFSGGVGMFILVALVFSYALRRGLPGLTREPARIGLGFKLIPERPG